MFKYKLDISYKGTNYHGWQKQNNAKTVQQEIENSLKILLNTKIFIIGSGRTDKGVHACQQIAHFEYNEKVDTDCIKYKLNSLLSKDISINSLTYVDKNFHARFDAKLRIYKYYITIIKDPFWRDYSLYYFRKIDINKLNRLCKILIDNNNFQSFTKKTILHNYRCNLKDCIWNTEDNKIIFTISANRFLRGMVRAIVGTLLKLHNNKNAIEDLKNIISKQNRKYAYFNVSAKGLFLYKVNY